MTQQPDWEEAGTVGDVNFAEYGGGLIYTDKTGVYDPEIEYVDPPPDDLDDGFSNPNARWTIYRVSLEKGVPDWGDLEAVADSSGQDPDELKADFESDVATERANAYMDWAGHYGWYELDQYPLELTRAEVEERYDVDLGYKRDIESALEEEAERMADQSSADGWSSVGDQTADDAENEGFDPETIVSFAEFGDAMSVNGDVLVDRSWEEALGLKPGKHPRLWSEVGARPLEDWLQQNGYELTDFGGRIPSEEGYASADHVISATAERLKLPAKEIEKVARSLDWWQEEIPRGTSGDGSIWAKRKPESAGAGGEVTESGRTTIAAARAELAKHGMSIKKTGYGGEYRVTVRGERDPDKGYFTDDLDDAVRTGIHMAGRK